MIRRFLRCAAVAAMAMVASAHVGSPTVFFEQSVGPYPVRVIIRPPDVVPGLADIVVRAGGSDVRRVVVRPVFWRAGVAGAPEGDVAKPVDGQPFTYSAQLWLMSRGAYSVYVTVEGDRGSHTAAVPVMALPTRTLDLSGGLAILLGALGIGLLAGLVTIVRAASSEALVPPGAEVDAATRRRGRIAAAFALPVLALLVFGGARWWRAEDAAYERTIHRPFALDARLGIDGMQATLTLKARDTSRFNVRTGPIMPDHGKMMHLFLVKDSSLDAMAHLHPTLGDSMTFTTPLPPLPAGRYRVYGDVVFQTGASFTLTTTFDIPTIAVTTSIFGPDETWIRDVDAAPLSRERFARFTDGSRAEWQPPSEGIVAGRPTELRFVVHDPSGAVAVLQPYLGMAGHLVVTRPDASVFVHLHPMGTVSPGAQQAFVLRDRGDTTPDGRLVVNERSAGAPHHLAYAEGVLGFPYEFPRPGSYRLFLQVRRAGRVMTAAFDLTVGAAQR